MAEKTFTYLGKTYTLPKGLAKTTIQQLKDFEGKEMYFDNIDRANDVKKALIKVAKINEEYVKDSFAKGGEIDVDAIERSVMILDDNGEKKLAKQL